MFANKVLQAITNTGTGAYQLNTTGTGAWKTWRSQFATGAQVAYYAENSTGTVWEFGYGTLTYGTPDQISRTLILSSTGALIDWASGDGTVYVMNVPLSQAMEGRWDATASMFVAAGRRPWTNVGAANKTVAAADAGGRFLLNTAAANRSVILPAIATVPLGFNVEIYGTSVSYNLLITPNGTETVDGGSAGAALTVPGNWVVNVFSDGSGWRTNYRYNAPALQPIFFAGQLFGLTLSAAGGTTTFGVAAGRATDKAAADVMVLASAFTKTTAAWVAGTGNGSLDTGTIANNTWYHVHLIKNATTSAVDVLTSLSPTAPTLPSGYTLSRRIGTLRTNGSGQWIAFIQDGDYFRWSASVMDVNDTNPGTTAQTKTLTVPTGVNVRWVGNVVLTIATTPCSIYVSDLAASDEAPMASGAANAAPGVTIGNRTGGSGAGAQLDIRTNTSSQIRYRLSASAADVVVGMFTLGWIDRRGQDA